MNKLIFFNNLIYGLSHEYGGKLDIYKVSEPIVDPKTGQRIVQRTKYSVKRAVLLPSELFRDFKYGAMIPGSNNYQYGGIIDVEKRALLINRKDLPKGFVLEANSYVVFNNQRYNIDNISTAELPNYYFCTAKKVKGEPAYQIKDACLKDKLVVTDTYEIVP